MLPIGPRERRFLLEVVRNTLCEYLRSGASPGYRTDAPCLLEHRGSFVTLRRRDSGELRGCRGECRPSRPLIESAVQQAIATATDDLRFQTVTADELPDLTIRISALTPLQPIRLDEVVLGRHGLLIVQGRRSGLLLPEVPARFGLRTPGEFLEALRRKAGLPADAYPDQDFELHAFETESWDDTGAAAASRPSLLD